MRQLHQLQPQQQRLLAACAQLQSHLPAAPAPAPAAPAAPVAAAGQTHLSSCCSLGSSQSNRFRSIDQVLVLVVVSSSVTSKPTWPVLKLRLLHRRVILSCPAPVPAFEDVGSTPMRQVIGKRLVESKQQIPHFYVEETVNAAPLMALRKQLNSIDGVKVTVNDLIVKATALTLVRHPTVNATFHGDVFVNTPMLTSALRLRFLMA